MRNSDDNADRPHSCCSVDPLYDELEALMARMQTPQARKAADSIASATPEELGEAVLKGYQGDTAESGRPPDSDPS